MRTQLKIKVVVLMLLFFHLIQVQGQVGINEPTPKLSLDVKANSSEVFSGIRAPRITGDELNAKRYTSDHNGAIVFVNIPASVPNQVGQTVDVYQKGYYYFDIGIVPGGKWVRWITPQNVSSASLVTVSAQSLDGVYVGGENLDASHKVSFRITNNSFQPINNIDFSNDVTVQNGNSTITVDGSANTSVSLAPGSSQVLTYQLSGVPEVGVLTAKFDKTLGNLHAEISTAVSLLNIASRNYKKYLISFSYNGKEFQGKINNSTEKVTFEIPYNTDLGITSAVNVNETSAAGEGGDVNDLTLTIPAGNYYNSPVATVTITVGGDGEYLIKKQAPGEEYTVATFNFTVSGKTYTVELIGVGGIIDRRFGDNSGHDFLYSPVEVTGIVTDENNANPQVYNKKWLNMNLGATYSDTNNAAFNPAIVKNGDDAHSDSKLKGSIFQWQRPADGHELVDYSLPAQPTLSSSTQMVASNWTPGHSDFILGVYRWNIITENGSGYSDQLWKAGGANNPCPVGYHVPTSQEWTNLFKAISSGQSYSGYLFGASYYTTKKVPNLTGTSGRHPQVGSTLLQGSYNSLEEGRPKFWTSDAVVGTGASNSIMMNSQYVQTTLPLSPAYGFSVRCVND